MKKKLRVYFDYTCPYCYHGMTDLLSLLPQYPELTVEWIPCEAHPFPETAWVHSRLASQMMLAAAENGADLIRFHQEVLEACFVKHLRIDDKDLLLDIAQKCGADGKKLTLDWENARYEQRVEEHNRLVWETLTLEAVPCYQSGSYFLKSHEDMRIPKERLKTFLDHVAEREAESAGW